MAKLYFKYGAMGSSKTAQALITKYNYEENDLAVWLIKPSADTRDGVATLRSRIGLEAQVEVTDEWAEVVTVTNEDGSTKEMTVYSMEKAAAELKEKGLIEYDWLFRLFAWVYNGEEKVTTGTFNLTTEMDYMALIRSMRSTGSGSAVTVKLSIPEGYSVQQIIELLAENGVASVEELTDAAANYEFQDSISAYHFYRSIYRAKRVFLLYDTRTEGVNRSGEVSRFVKQLKYHHGANITEEVVTYKIESIPSGNIKVEKSDEIIAKLLEHNFSASSLNTYLDCPLKFYFQAVEKIKEEEEVTEQVEANVFGTMFHEVMQKIYEPYCGEIISPELIDKWMKSEAMIQELIRNAFANEMKIKNIEGKNKIVEALILRYVLKTLEQDRKKAPFAFTSVEERCFVKAALPRTGAEVKFFGIIDRRDGVDENDRIVDYKTGGYSISWKEVGDMFDLPADKRGYTALQMMFYLYLLDMKGLVKDVDKAVMAVCSLKDLFGTTKGMPAFGITRADYDLFVERLYDLVENRILNKEIPFEAKGEGKTCEYCPYSIVCNK